MPEYETESDGGDVALRTFFYIKTHFFEGQSPSSTHPEGEVERMGGAEVAESDVGLPGPAKD